MANTINAQPTGGCVKELPGTSEQLVAVSGNTYRYRRYLRSIGLRWVPAEQHWLGRLSDGKIWFLEERLELRVRFKEPLTHFVDNSRYPAPRPRRKKPVHKPECFTAAEYYVADRLVRGPYSYEENDPLHQFQPERNINLRRCYWGCELCEQCLECVSNIDENLAEPVPGLDLDDGVEQKERRNAVLPVSPTDQ